MRRETGNDPEREAVSIAEGRTDGPLPATGATEGVLGPHWIVKTHHQMRTFSFANSFAFSAVHIWGQGYSAWVWALLFVTFLVYPQIAYWRASRASDTQRAELQNLLFDCFLVAIPIAMMGFPLWITFTLFIATTINNAIASGQRGTKPAIFNFALGSLLGAAINGFRVSPGHSHWVTALCIFGLCWYLLGIGHVAYKRTLKLRQIREELKGLQGRLRDQASRDPLTGLYNRRYLEETMERELARCEREGVPLCVILIDLDHFKTVNDRFGHHAGDAVIQEMARFLISEARHEDVPCRYGGEEFMLLMSKMPMEVARERAEGWRRRFAQIAVPVGDQSVRTTLSIGIAEYPTHGNTPRALSQCADVALYEAKAGGRDRVVCYMKPGREETVSASRT
jgi:diguanylate cyclase